MTPMSKNLEKIKLIEIDLPDNAAISKFFYLIKMHLKFGSEDVISVLSK